MEKKYLSDTGLERLATYLQTDDVTIERAADGSLKLSTGQCVWHGHKITWDNLPASEQAKYGIVIFDDDGTTITIDSSLSTTSENPVKNKVITNALNGKADSSSVPTKTSDLTNDSSFITLQDLINAGLVTTYTSN